MTASVSFDGLLSVTKKLIIPSDFMRRLQPRKKMPNTTVSDKTHMTAIWTTLMMKRLLSSGAAATKLLSVTTEEKLQQKNSSVLLSSPPSVWLNTVLFIFPLSERQKIIKSNFQCAGCDRRRERKRERERDWEREREREREREGERRAGLRKRVSSSGRWRWWRSGEEVEEKFRRVRQRSSGVWEAALASHYRRFHVFRSQFHSRMSTPPRR